jgi:hypothetical protein
LPPREDGVLLVAPCFRPVLAAAAKTREKGLFSMAGFPGPAHYVKVLKEGDTKKL